MTGLRSHSQCLVELGLEPRHIRKLDSCCTAKNEAVGGRQWGQGRAGPDMRNICVSMAPRMFLDQFPENQFSEEQLLGLCPQVINSVLGVS